MLADNSTHHRYEQFNVWNIPPINANRSNLHLKIAHLSSVYACGRKREAEVTHMSRASTLWMLSYPGGDAYISKVRGSLK